MWLPWQGMLTMTLQDVEDDFSPVPEDGGDANISANFFGRPIGNWTDRQTRLAQWYRAAGWGSVRYFRGPSFGLMLHNKPFCIYKPKSTYVTREAKYQIKATFPVIFKYKLR